VTAPSRSFVLVLLGLAFGIAWVVYRAATREERHARQLADCQIRARLERRYPDGLYLCLKDRYGWSEIDAMVQRVDAEYHEALEHR